MHDNNQYEYKLSKLDSDLDSSQRKATALEAELRRTCEAWELYYSEAIKQLKQRIEELGSNAIFETIEKMLVRISEKDKIIG